MNLSSTPATFAVVIKLWQDTKLKSARLMTVMTVTTVLTFGATTVFGIGSSPPYWIRV
jgi:hypothetical protein